MIERAEFVSALGRVDYLQQDRENLDAQIQALDRKLAAMLEQVRTCQAMIQTFEDQLTAEREKEAVIEAERQRLAEEAASSSRWSELKSYGLAILGAFAVAAILL